jgi:hypothetical protein
VPNPRRPREHFGTLNLADPHPIPPRVFMAPFPLNPFQAHWPTPINSMSPFLYFFMTACLHNVATMYKNLCIPLESLSVVFSLPSVCSHFLVSPFSRLTTPGRFSLISPTLTFCPHSLLFPPWPMNWPLCQQTGNPLACPLVPLTNKPALQTNQVTTHSPLSHTLSPVFLLWLMWNIWSGTSGFVELPPQVVIF